MGEILDTSSIEVGSLLPPSILVEDIEALPAFIDGTASWRS
jgi:hypothetical protein